jgi:SAM-dependent methyltransferase
MNIQDVVPPDELIYIGAGNFKEIGNEFCGYLVDLAGLQPHHRVLDVGCGVGRVAIPLTQYLQGSGSYEGIDIVLDGIDWCRKMITPRCPHFRFQVADLFNRSYNPQGRCQARTYTFPFPDASFDLVYLTSVFTHMLPEELENYLYEISRVLKRGSKCLITYFLLNDESAALLAAGQSQYDFKHKKGVYRTITMHRPEDAVCYDEPFVVRLYEKYGLAIDGPIRYGSWSGRARFLSHQDIIVATKLGSAPALKPSVSLLERVSFQWRRTLYAQVLARLRRLRSRSSASAVNRHARARHGS